MLLLFRRDNFTSILLILKARVTALPVHVSLKSISVEFTLGFISIIFHYQNDNYDFSIALIL